MIVSAISELLKQFYLNLFGHAIIPWFLTASVIDHATRNGLEKKKNTVCYLTTKSYLGLSRYIFCCFETGNCIFDPTYFLFFDGPQNAKNV